MREIKFRAWDKTDEVMFNVGAIAWSHNAFKNRNYTFGTNPHCYEDKCKSFPHINEDCIFMQYTNIKDSNDVEIYEGDIVSIVIIAGDIITGNVIMNAGRWSVKCNDRYYSLVSIWYKTIEVIGNIFETQELKD